MASPFDTSGRTVLNMAHANRNIPARQRLIFALDVPDRARAIEWMDRLGDAVTFYKIGLELLSGGEYFDVLRELKNRGRKICGGLKCHVFPATVPGVVGNLAGYAAEFGSLHS